MRLTIFFLALTFYLSSYSQTKWKVGLNFYESGLVDINSTDFYGAESIDHRSNSNFIPGLRFKYTDSHHVIRFGLEGSNGYSDNIPDEYSLGVFSTYTTNQMTLLSGYQYEVLSNSKLSFATGLDLGVGFGKINGVYENRGCFNSSNLELDNNYSVFQVSPTLSFTYRTFKNLALSVGSCMRYESALRVQGEMVASAKVGWVPLSTVTLYYSLRSKK